METYSFSKLKKFEDCKYSYYKNYFEQDKDKIGHGTSEFGTFAHEILEKYAKGELEVYELLQYYLKHYDEEVKSTFVIRLSDTFSKDFSNNYFESGKRYFETFGGFDNLNILESEFEFDDVYKNKFRINGKVDLICTDQDGKLIVIDHKSKSKFKNKTEKHDYARQLYIYAFAIKNKYGKFPDKLVFNMFRVDEWVEFDFNMQDYKETMKWVENQVEEIESCLDFEPQVDSWYCRNFCEFRGHCDKIK